MHPLISSFSRQLSLVDALFDIMTTRTVFQKTSSGGGGGGFGGGAGGGGGFGGGKH